MAPVTAAGTDVDGADRDEKGPLGVATGPGSKRPAGRPSGNTQRPTRPPVPAKPVASGARSPSPGPAPGREGSGGTRAWVEATGGVCPPSHPIKAKVASRLFHLPGMFAYDRTRPDRCYRSEDEAVADGFTRAKR